MNSLPRAEDLSESRRSRANGEGSVFRSAVRGWCASITDLEGRRVTRKAPEQSKRGAERLLRRLLAGREAGALARRSMTLASYAPQWLEAARLRGCRPRTLEAYADRLRVHVLPALGRVPLDKLRPGQVQALYAAKLDGGLSPATVGHIHLTLGGLLKHAKKRGLVGRNILESVDPPKVPRYQARALSIEEALRLLAAVKAHPHGALWTFLLGTGCRFGEAAGLTWDAVDLGAGTAVIRQAAVRVRRDGKTRVLLAGTKSAAGNRTLPLPPWVIEALRAQRARCAELRLAAGPAWDDMGLVFPSAIGTPLRENHVLVQWHRRLREAGLPSIRMHDMRHTFATLMLDSSEDLVAVSRSLGHASVGITANLYAGRVPGAQRRAVARYGELLAGANS